MKESFTKNSMFSYNLRNKQLFFFTSIATLSLALLLLIYYVFSLRHSDFIVIQAINSATRHIYSNISSASLLGVFYGAIIGGIFFIIMPVEALFASFLRAGHNGFILIVIFLAGFVVSYTINYYIGMRLANISKKIITSQKFYKIKGLINRYGAAAIFVINVLPLPSQPLSAILGVFKYNRARFYTFFILGQFVKYSLITIGLGHMFITA